MISRGYCAAGVTVRSSAQRSG